MKGESVATPAPARRPWLLITALVFLGQLALIFLMSDKSVLRPQSPAAAPVLHLAGDGTIDLLTVSDPTLFALPHREGFSAGAWLKIPEQKLPALDWSAPMNWLPLATRSLGETFERFIRTNQFETRQSVDTMAAQVAFPALPPLRPAREQSTYRVEGGLSGRRLLTPFDLPAWPNADLLTNTVVQLAVDALGQPVSATVLGNGSGSRAADQQALEKAASARFESLVESGPNQPPPTLSRLSWGTILFEWQTLPLVTTNAP